MHTWSLGRDYASACSYHMVTDTPHVYWLHWYATGDGAALARTIRAAVASTNHRRPDADSR